MGSFDANNQFAEGENRARAKRATSCVMRGQLDGFIFECKCRVIQPRLDDIKAFHKLRDQQRIRIHIEIPEKARNNGYDYYTDVTLDPIQETETDHPTAPPIFPPGSHHLTAHPRSTAIPAFIDERMGTVRPNSTLRKCSTLASMAFAHDTNA